MNNKRKAQKGSVGVEATQNRLRLRLPRQLYEGKQKYLSLGLADIPANRLLAEQKARQIELDILAGYFDPTLLKYKPRQYRESNTQLLGKSLSLVDLWVQYTAYKSPQLEQTTILRDYGKIEKRITKFPVHQVKAAVEIRDHLLDTYSAETAKRTLVQLNACCKWAVRSKLIESNCFEGMAGEIKAKKSRQTSRFPFSTDEVKSIVSAFESDTFCSPHSAFKHSYYTSYVRFLFLTGCRPQEAVALQWKHIESDHIYICEAIAAGLKIRKSTKTNKPREFPINTQLRALFDSIKPQSIKPDTLVFPAIRGKELNTQKFLSQIWKPILMSLLNDGKLRRYLPQYNARHTFITHCLENGVSVVQVAEWVGNSPEIIMKHYAGTIRHVQVPEF